MIQLKKFKASSLGLICLFVIDLFAFVLYLCCLYEIDYASTATIKTALTVISNTLLVAVSILTTSLLSVPLIDVRTKNTLCSQLLTEDVLGTPQLLAALSESQKSALMKNIEAGLHFNDCPIKEAMLTSVRSKIQNFPCVDGYNDDYYLESCEYIVRCTIGDTHIRKTILKRLDIRSYKKKVMSGFPLCVTSFADLGTEPYMQIAALTVNKIPKRIQDLVASEEKDSKESLAAKSGYLKSAVHTYTGKLALKPNKSTVLEIEYSTLVPITDPVYICRVSSPCKKFHFQFSLDGDNKNNYRVNLSAFGFVDDGSNAPNHNDDSPSVSVSFDDWIFPQDGVVVTITKKEA